ncbi:MAG TPA: RDD family protein [Conexibacter sp.]|nr:RDD family protein [Conexibacter sp.]
MHTRELADWWTRAGAFVLDQLIVAGAIFAISFAIAGAAPRQGEMRASLAFYAIVLVVGGLYAPLLMARRGARNGQTLGKQLVGIRVVRTDGRPVGVWTGVLRTVVAQQLLIGVTVYLYAIVDYLWPLRDRRNQALHDKLARTWVLRADASAAPPPAPGEPAREDTPAQVWLPPRAPGV